MNARHPPGAAPDEALLLQFSNFLARRIGLHFPRPRWPDLLRGLARAAPELACTDLEACMRWLLTTPLEQRQVEILASHLSVGETYFYREPAVFAALEQHVLPPLIAERRASSRRLRLWSAACCTGEEAYTLAILLDRLLPDLEQWNITLLATDINPHFLARAQAGAYREWSFRGTPAWFKEGYFSHSAEGDYRLLPRIRRLVRFAHLNLVDDSYPALDNDTNAMDLVLCRNVLMYFDEPSVRAVLDKLRRVLLPDGWLALSATESSPLAGFRAVPFAEATLYRKHEGQLAPLPLPPQAPTAEPALPAWLATPAETPPVTAPAPSATDTTQPAASPIADNAYQQALAHYVKGDYRQAAALTGAAADDAASLALAARAWANLGQLDEARRCGEAAIAADKCDPALRYLLASLLAEQGCDAAAEVALKQALYLDQDFVLAHFALANLYRRLGQPAQTARHFATARQLLTAYPPGAALPAAEGLSAGRLLDIIDGARA